MPLSSEEHRRGMRYTRQLIRKSKLILSGISLFFFSLREANNNRPAAGKLKILIPI